MFRVVKNNFFTLLLAGGIGVTATTAMAQGTMPDQQPATETNYSEEELKLFVEATESVQAVQTKHQGEMVAVIQEKGLTPEEFQSMAQQQHPDAAAPEMTEEKKAAFANALNEVMAIQQTMNTDLESALADHDMEMQQYQQMAMNIQQSPELSQKVMKMMEK